MDCFHEVWHAFLGPFRRDAQSVKRLANTAVITRLAEVFQTLHLSFITFWIHFKDGDGEWFLFSIGVHAHDLANAFIYFALIAIGRVRDLALEESHFNGRKNTPQNRRRGGSNRMPAVRCRRSVPRRRSCLRVDRLCSSPRTLPR